MYAECKRKLTLYAHLTTCFPPWAARSTQIFNSVLRRFFLQNWTLWPFLTFFLADPNYIRPIHIAFKLLYFFTIFQILKTKYLFFILTSGDDRINQNPMLAVLQVMFLRLHNRLASELSRLNPHWGDETLYQEARKVVVAAVQRISYTEYLPIIVSKC